MEQVKEVKEAKRVKKGKLSAKRRWHWFGIFGFSYLTVYVIVLFTLLGWAFVKSIHQFDDFILSGASATSWPNEFSFESYKQVLTVIKYKVRDTSGELHTVYMFEMVVNSLLYAAITTIVHLVTVISMAYVTAKYNFKFNKVIIGLFYFQMLVPIVGTMSAGLKLQMELGLFDTWLGVGVQHLHYFGGVTFLIYYDAFKKLSDGYSEAAKIDGAGHYRIMFSICFPLVKALWMMGIMTDVIAAWNNYSTPLVYLPSYPTVAYGLYIFNQAKSGGEMSKFAYIPYKLAGFMLLLLPTTLFFLIFKEKMLGATTTGGGLKE